MTRTAPFLAGAAAAALLVAGCGKKPDVDARNASVAEVANQVAAAGVTVKMKPGKWSTTAKVESVEGLTGPAADAMKQAMMKAPVQTFEVCLTQADVDKPAGEMFNKGMENCTYDHFTMGDGALDAKMTCKMNRQTVTSALKGSFGPESYQVASTTEMDQPGIGHLVTRTRIDSKRVGDCDARTAG